MKNKKKIKDKKGFTLIEVITSLAIFGIASVMLIGVIYTAMQITMRATAKYRTQLRAASGVELIAAGRADMLNDTEYSDITVEGNQPDVVVIFGNPD